MKRNLLLAVVGSLLCVGQAMADTTINASPVTPPPGVSGLAGSVWLEGSGAMNIAGATAIVAGGSPSATFHSTQVNYNGGDGSTIQQFLNSNSLTDGNTVTPSSVQSSQVLTSVYDFKGYIDVLPSDLVGNTATFALNHDDGGSLSIAGALISSSDCCGIDTNNVTFTNGAGYYPRV
jgi:hypothetical protein